MPDEPLPEQPERPLEQAPEGPSLEAQQRQTLGMLRQLGERANTPELLRRGVEVSQRLEELSKRLEEENGESQQRQILLAQQARVEFEGRLRNPDLLERLYEHKELVLAGAGLLALGSWIVFSESPFKKWGMTFLAVATGGLIGSRYLQEQELLEATMPGPTAPPAPVTEPAAEGASPAAPEEPRAPSASPELSEQPVPSAPAVPTPGDQRPAPEARAERTAPQPSEQLSESVTGLNDISITVGGDDYVETAITFSNRPPAQLRVFRVNWNGEGLRKKVEGNWTTITNEEELRALQSDPELGVLQYLRHEDHGRYLTRIVEAMRVDETIYPRLVTAIIFLQQRENDTGRPPIDVAKKLYDTWRDFRRHDEIRSTANFTQMLMTMNFNTMNNILRILRSLSAAPATETLAPGSAPSSPAVEPAPPPAPTAPAVRPPSPDRTPERVVETAETLRNLKIYLRGEVDRLIGFVNQHAGYFSKDRICDELNTLKSRIESARNSSDALQMVSTKLNEAIPALEASGTWVFYDSQREEAVRMLGDLKSKVERLTRDPTDIP